MTRETRPRMNATEQAYHIIRNDILTGKLAEAGAPVRLSWKPADIRLHVE